LLRPPAALVLAIASLLVLSAPATAQDPPPKIGPFVLDLHGTIPRFPHDQQLADSRGLDINELPGSGIGAHASANVYLLKWGGVTFGLGAEGAVARSHSAGRALSSTRTGRAVTERFMHIAPDLSLNFGTGDGWSYVSGGMGSSVWSIVPDGEPAGAPDSQRLQTINYGGGARWFAKRHLAFSFDVRFYAVYPGTGELGRPGGPRTTLVFIGGGVSIK
jgi:hypothetical protein